MQLARKRHIGNDVAIVIFSEASRAYLTSLIASQFNHIIIVVSVKRNAKGRKVYTVAVTAKESVPPFGPPLPKKGEFSNKRELRAFLIQKCK